MPSIKLVWEEHPLVTFEQLQNCKKLCSGFDIDFRFDFRSFIPGDSNSRRFLLLCSQSSLRLSIFGFGRNPWNDYSVTIFDLTDVCQGMLSAADCLCSYPMKGRH